METKTPDYLKNKFDQNIEEGKLYTLINKDDNDKSTIPADPNLLRFYERNVSLCYSKQLFLDKSNKKYSEMIFNEMLIFFIFFLLTCLCLITFVAIAYHRGKLPLSHLIFHVIINVFIAGFSVVSLVSLKKPEFFIRKLRIIFSGITLAYQTYLVFGNKLVLSQILGTQVPEYGIPFGLPLIGMAVVFRFVLCHSFLHFLVVNLVMILEYVILIISIPRAFELENLNQFFCILIFVVLQTIDSKHAEFVMKRDFWLQFQYEQSFKTSMGNKYDENDGSVKTETEILISTCDQLKNSLKHCSQVIMFKDIKESLKIAQVKIEDIKQRIGRGNYLNEVKFEQQADIDPEDKKFISQNFLDFSHINTPERSAITEITVVDFKEKTENFPFSHYGIEKLESILSQFGKIWAFDIWFIHNATGQSISIIGKYLFQKWQLNEYLKQPSDTSDNFFTKLESGYNKNPYHNACHAADVLHSQLFFITHSELSRSLTQLDTICCIISSLGHDIGHPSLTNRFLVNNYDEIALIYNDFSVLENMHASKTFKILKSEGSSILDNLSNEEIMKSRKMIIEMILETDMSKHFEILGKFRTRAITLSNVDISTFEDRCQVLGMALKCSDIGHSAKDWDLHEKWSLLVCEEFFNQGDIEKARAQVVSMYCDRETTDIPKSQAGFIRNICIPLYEAWSFYLKSETVDKFCLNQLRRNLESWSQKKKRRCTVKYIESKTEVEKLKRIQTSN
jgi:hypothetical protein